MSQPLLEDVQARPDTRGIALAQVGISEVEMPLRIIQRNGHFQQVAATATMSVSLPEQEKGTHMSRFIIQLAQWSQRESFSLNLHAFLTELKTRLHATDAYIDLKFKYFIDKPSPVTQQSAPMAYLCQLQGAVQQDRFVMTMGLEIPVSTLCPCSKAISDFGAHNQRAIIRAKLHLNITAEETCPMPWLETMIAQLENCSSCPVYPLLKRADEKYVTERQYTNAKFVEDVIRDCVLVLRQDPRVSGFLLEVEALESIHGHNAWTRHAENFKPSHA